jgi:cell division septum initiation protein DivIVA
MDSGADRFNFAKANMNKLQLENAVLQQQNTTHQDTLDVLRVDSKHRQELDAAVIAKYQDQLSRQESNNHRTIQTLERRADAAERNLTEANRSAEVLRAEINKKTLETAIPSAAHKEIGVLEARLQEQLTLFKSLTQRASTIETRYKEGDLASSFFFAVCFVTYRR